MGQGSTGPISALGGKGRHSSVSDLHVHTARQVIQRGHLSGRKEAGLGNQSSQPPQQDSHGAEVHLRPWATHAQNCQDLGFCKKASAFYLLSATSYLRHCADQPSVAERWLSVASEGINPLSLEQSSRTDGPPTDAGRQVSPDRVCPGFASFSLPFELRGFIYVFLGAK